MQAKTANPLLYWAPAIMLSLLAHATLVMMIQRGTAPDPVAMTEEIRTRIDMSSLDVPSQRAEAQEAEGEMAESSEASGERLGVQAVPTSPARPVAATAQNLAALAATAPVTRPATAREAAMPAISAGGARLSAAAPAAPNLTSAAAPTTAVAPAAVPSAVAAASPTPPGEALATVHPAAATLEATAAEAPVLAAATAAPSAIAPALPSADALAVTESRGPIAPAVQPPSMTMAAAAVPAQALPGAQPSGTELAPVTAAPARLNTVAASAESVAPARPAANPVVAQAADSTALIATESTAPAVPARPPPTTLMTAAAVPAQIMPGARPSGTELAPVTAATARLNTVAASAESVAPARPSAKPVVAQAADATTLIATESTAPAIAARPPPAPLMAAAVQPPSLTMAAAAVPAQIMPGARPNGTELAPVAAASDRLNTVVAGGQSVAPAKPSAKPVVAQAADPTALIATVSTAPAVAARPPPTTLMAAAVAPAETVASGRAKSQQVASLRPAPEPTATIDSGRPDIAAPAAIAVPRATELAANATSDIAGFVAPTDTAEAAVVATAALAWSGAANTVLDEQSLAAIQSFMRPGDVAGSAAFAGSVRDGIGAALAQYPCSRLQAAFQPDTGGLEIRGHVPTPDMKAAVVGMLEKTVGGSIPVGGSVLVLPQPQCGVLDAVERLGVPQSRDQVDDPLVVGEEAQARIEQYEEGARMTMRLQGAEYDAHIYADYYDADGNVIHLLPNEYRPENQFAADAPILIGNEGSGFRMIAQPPFGQDIAVILATTTPLYDGVRPLVERADEYLPWLHARVDAFRSVDPDFHGEWAYLFVITGAVGAFAGR